MDIDEIKKDLENRYNGCRLTMREFLDLGSLGFEFQYLYIYHRDAPGLVFMYTSLGQGMARNAVQPTMDDEMEFRNAECVGVNDEMLLKVLRIMDRATIKARIDKDDYRISGALDFFNMEEINNLLKYSIKNGKKNCTAVLLNYKNEHYSSSWKH